MVSRWLRPINLSTVSGTVGALAVDQVLLSIQRMNVNSMMNNVSPVNLSRFRGLSRIQFDSPGSLVRFELVRDAGTIRFDGYVASGGGGGTFEFVPNPNFADRMSSSGYSALTPEKTFLCAVYDVGLDFARDIQRTGLEGVTLENLIRLAGPGITADWIRQVQSLGYPKLSVEDAIRLRGHGITPDYIREARRRFKDISINDLIRLKGAGIL
jgi:hypothetical protein